MPMVHARIPLEEFSAERLDSLTCYDYLPGDPVHVVGDGDARSAAECAAVLLDRPRPDDEAVIDRLALKLLNGCPSIAGFPNWGDLALKLSASMARNLTASGSRSLRMRTQRLYYYILAILDSRSPIEGRELVTAETQLRADKPWDYFRRPGEEWWIGSGRPNIQRSRGPGDESQWSVGLPTQIDPLPNGDLAFGSIYTPGAATTDGSTWWTLEHDDPVVLVFLHDGRRYFVDHFCRLYAEQPRELLVQIERPQVHFARYADGFVYLMDNSDFGHLTVHDMTTGRSERLSILPVQVANDIAIAPDARYLIDKQQGGIFKFTSGWQLERRVLRFGRGAGQLMDPVAIRLDGDQLLAVSWLTGKLTEIEAF